MDTRIRPALTTDDACTIARIHVSSWRAAYRGILPQSYLRRLSVESLTLRWHGRMRRAEELARRGPAVVAPHIAVVESEGGVVGFTMFGPSVRRSLAGFAGEVFYLYVLPEHQGNGYGRALMRHALDTLAEIPWYWVVVRVLRDNAPARRFYAGMGMRPDGHHEFERLAGRSVSVVRYARTLNPVFDFEAWRRRADAGP